MTNSVILSHCREEELVHIVTTDSQVCGDSVSLTIQFSQIKENGYVSWVYTLLCEP